MLIKKDHFAIGTKTRKEFFTNSVLTIYSFDYSIWKLSPENILLRCIRPGVSKFFEQRAT